MRVKTYLDVDVVGAARQRLIQLFQNTCPITVSFSGGKDSLCLLDLILCLKDEGRVDTSNTTVLFIDEEAMYEDVIDIVKKYRLLCLQRDIKFIWYAMEMKHYNCFNSLTNDESFILFDRFKEKEWVRDPPDFAVREDPLLIPRLDRYQQFLARKGKGSLDIIGIRESESVQRLTFMAKGASSNFIFRGHAAFPIYDWTDGDVWLYIKNRHIEFPVAYMKMYQAGVPMNRLRISQFFSIDTAASLVQLAALYPGLMESIVKREPNAYLAALYWDSEMFKGKTKKRKELEGKKDPVLARNHVMKLLSDIPKYFETVHLRESPYRYRRFLLKYSPFFQDKDWQTIDEALTHGDPKGRTMRALMIHVVKVGSAESRKLR